MFDRRRFCGVAAAASLPFPAHAAGAGLPFYASVGAELFWYGFNTQNGELVRKGSVRLPSNVQYAWPDMAGFGFLYVAASNNRPDADAAANKHGLQAFRIGGNGALTPVGAPVPLRQRPVHITLDAKGHYLAAAYNIPAAVSVHPIGPDGAIGAEIPQPALDTGIYAHQVRFTPAGRSLVLVTRGNDPRPGKPEDPGALKVFAFKDGVLSDLQSLAPASKGKGKGLGFGPRHVDFGGRHCFVSLERENSIGVYDLKPDGKLGDEPLFIRNALLDTDAKARFPGQTAGPIHVHPSGRFVYQTNRGSGTVDFKGRKVWNGGENNIVVWAVDPATGEPTRIQNADSHGFEVRTFSITPDGRWLIAAAQVGLDVREGDATRFVSAGFAVYRIGTDGRLTFVRKQDVDTSAGPLFWSGLLTMP